MAAALEPAVTLVRGPAAANVDAFDCSWRGSTSGGATTFGVARACGATMAAQTTAIRPTMRLLVMVNMVPPFLVIASMRSIEWRKLRGGKGPGRGPAKGR